MVLITHASNLLNVLFSPEVLSMFIQVNAFCLLCINSIEKNSLNFRELQRLDSITSSPVLSHFTETILGVVTIRAYNQENRFMEILFKKIEANNVAFMILNSSNRWLGITLVIYLNH